MTRKRPEISEELWEEIEQEGRGPKANLCFHGCEHYRRRGAGSRGGRKWSGGSRNARNEGKCSRYRMDVIANSTLCPTEE